MGQSGRSRGSQGSETGDEAGIPIGLDDLAEERILEILFHPLRAEPGSSLR